MSSIHGRRRVYNRYLRPPSGRWCKTSAVPAPTVRLVSIFLPDPTVLTSHEAGVRGHPTKEET